MKRTFFARYALLIICIVCFMGPFALRGARMSMQRMTNRVKDWLPSDFAETADLEWFGQHFMGEQFVIVTWPGCSEDDPRYQKLVDRIQHQIAPPEHHETGGPADALAALARKPFEELTPDRTAGAGSSAGRRVGGSTRLVHRWRLPRKLGPAGREMVARRPRPVVLHHARRPVVPLGRPEQHAELDVPDVSADRAWPDQGGGRVGGHLWSAAGAGTAQRVPRESGNPDGSAVQVDHDRPGYVEAAVAQGRPAVAARRGRRDCRKRSTPAGVGPFDRRLVWDGRQADLHHADVQRRRQTGLAAGDRPAIDGPALWDACGNSRPPSAAFPKRT